MRHRGRLASALSTVITRTPSEHLVFSTQSTGTVLRAEGDEINYVFFISSEHSREPWENNAIPLTVILSLATHKCSVTVNRQKDGFTEYVPSIFLQNLEKKTLSLQFKDYTRIVYPFLSCEING